MKPLRVLSLFDGISCGQVALERAGIPVEVYYASEIDKYAIQVTQKNYPNTIQLGDVEKIDFTQYEGKIDLLIGGSPCTNLSIAGNHKGLEGDESRLFWEYVRAIKECKPKYFLLENVESMSDKDKEIISQELGCYPIMINSSLVSAQNRKRYYWFNWGLMQYNLFGFPTCDIPQPKDKGILLKDILESSLSYQGKSDCLTARYQGATFPHDYFRNQRTQIAEPVCVNSQSGRGDNPTAQPSIQDRIYDVNAKSTSLTTSFLPNIAEPVIYQLPQGYNEGDLKRGKCPTLTTSRWQDNNLLLTPYVQKKYEEFAEEKGFIPEMFNPYNKQEIREKTPTLTAQGNTQTSSSTVMLFQPIRLQEYEKSKGQAQRVYSIQGKSVVLNANGGGQGGKTGLYKIDLPDGEYIIRKLTPVECERLQTLPDNYTEGISNSQRYKCIGNGWTVDVIAHIFKHILDTTKN